MTEKYYGWGLPIDISTHGASIDRLIYVVHIFMLLLFVGWAVFLTLVLVRFRKKKGQQVAYKPQHFKVPTYLEVGVALAEVILLCAFSFPIYRHIRNNFPDPSQSLHIKIVAEQFAWNIHYPGADGVFGKTDRSLMSASNPLGLDTSDPHATDDITTINQLHIPVHKPIVLDLMSKDVIHSFSIPVMRVKQDVIPGQSIPIWFEATKTGDFEIACAQLCGLGHYRMRGFFSVQSKDEFESWLKEQATVKN